MRYYELRVDLPFLKQKSQFAFDDDNGNIFMIENQRVAEYPLRAGLSGYLWLLLTERKYLKKIF
jgi:hypothetical protein